MTEKKEVDVYKAIQPGFMGVALTLLFWICVNAFCLFSGVTRTEYQNSLFGVLIFVPMFVGCIVSMYRFGWRK